MGKVTIYDIAKELNVSTATVNRALNNKKGVSAETQEKVLEKARALGFTVNRAAKSLARRQIVLDFIIYNRVPVFHNEVIAGVEKAFEDLRDFNVIGYVHSFSGMEYMVHQQILDKMQTILDEKHDGLMMLGTFNMNGYQELLEEYEKNNMKIAFVNGDLQGCNRTFSIRQNADLAGRLAAELLYWFTQGGEVAVFTGRPEVMDHKESINGFCAECKKRNMSVAAVYENHDDEEFAMFNTQRLLQKYPQVKGLYINTANSATVCAKMEELGYGGKIKLVTSDLFDDVRYYMKRNVIQATIFQDPFQQGYMAVEQLYRCIAEGIQPESTLYIQPTVILQSNV